MVSSLNDEIDFRVSFDDSDDEDYTVIFDKNSFSYKKNSINDLKTDSENDNEKVNLPSPVPIVSYLDDLDFFKDFENEFPAIVYNDALTSKSDFLTDLENDIDKVNMPSFLSPEPTVSYFDDLDFFKDFKNEFPAIVYNDALTFKSDFLTEPTMSIQHIDEFNLKDETSLSECDEEEQNVLYFNDVFPFNVIYPDDSKSDKDNDNDKIDIKPSPVGNVINTDVGAYAQSTIYRTYSLNEYSVFDTDINTAYHGDLAAKKSTKLVKYQSSGILCVIVVMLTFRRMFNTHPCS
ncbi:hypothetical protein Tco_1219475 [Tanacetum coccineum]